MNQGKHYFVSFELWCLTPLSKIFKLYRGGNRSSRRKPPIYRSHWQNFST